MTISPSQRTAAELVRQGLHPFKTEHWDAFAHKRKDLFGFADFLALGQDEVWAVQTTTADNLASRIRKIESDELADNVAAVRKAGIGILAHGWYYSRRQRAWVCNVEDLS